MFAINLKQLYRELDPWLIVDGKNDHKTPIKKMFTELAMIPKQKKDLIWNKMEDIEMVMRQHFKDLGMLMPKVQDPRFLFQKQR